MPDLKLPDFLKTDDAEEVKPESQENKSKAISAEGSSKYKNSKRKIVSICNALTLETAEYDPAKSIRSIEGYITNANHLGRILYSEVSNFVFGLDESKRGTVAANLETLLIYSLDENNVASDDCRKIVLKLYDHFHLVLHQIENAKNIFSGGIRNAKADISSEAKNMEKEYISILGIFASVVLAFVGGLTFSTSVLDNIHQVSIYRLIIIALIIGIVFIDMIWVLMDFVRSINGQEKRRWMLIISLNALLVAGIFATAFSYKFGWWEKTNVFEKGQMQSETTESYSSSDDLAINEKVLADAEFEVQSTAR